MKKRLFSLSLFQLWYYQVLRLAAEIKTKKRKHHQKQRLLLKQQLLLLQQEIRFFQVASEDPQVPLDMQLNTYSIIMKVTDNVTESLLTTNAEGKLEPTLLAEMPTLSEDKLTYSFTLKDGVKFHNDAPLTSADVKYSLKEWLKKKLKMSSLI